MNLKAGWIRFKGGFDFLASGFAGWGRALDLFVMVPLITGASYIGSFYSDYIQDPLKNHSDHMDVELAEKDDGMIVRMPDMCNGESDFYLLSRKSNNDYEISALEEGYAKILSQDEQDDIAKDIDQCLTIMYSWAEADNYDFADEFYFANSVPYTETVLVHDLSEGVKALYKDVLIDDLPDSLDTQIKKYDDYDSDKDNTRLYRNKFASAASGLYMFDKDFSSDETNFDRSGAVRNAERIPQHDYAGYTLNDWLIRQAIGLSGMFLLLGATGSRGDEYKKRQAARREEIAKSKQLQGLDNTKF